MLTTKIVATVGPATRDPGVLAKLLSAGVDVVRLNLSHGSIDDHIATVTRVRAAAAQVGRTVAILADLQGPKIRVGELDASRTLAAGDTIRLHAGVRRADDGTIPVVYREFAMDLHPGDRVLFDDGRLECRTLTVQSPMVTAEVVVGGVLSSRKGINMPGVAVSAATPTEQDLEQLGLLDATDIDYFAMSFVRDAADVIRLRKALTEQGSSAHIIAKLERPEAITNLAELLTVSQAVMVARGDLGVELGVEKVPAVQKQVIAAANAAGVPVITATEMLESMVSASRPTRAEASDVANAVFDGTDAVMLSAETASGAHPVESVRFMRRICDEAEQAGGLDRHVPRAPDGTPAGAIARAACQLVADTGAVAVVCLTETGSTARLVATSRPGVPVLALTASEHARRLCALYPGVTSALMPTVADHTTRLALINDRVRAARLAVDGAVVVVVSGQPGKPGRTNRVEVHHVDTDLLSHLERGS